MQCQWVGGGCLAVPPLLLQLRHLRLLEQLAQLGAPPRATGVQLSASAGSTVFVGFVLAMRLWCVWCAWLLLRVRLCIFAYTVGRCNECTLALQQHTVSVL